MIHGFINRCFDIVHSGHINLFQNAKQQCDRLTIGLNSDSSIRKIKGSDRPINNENDRRSFLLSIRYIDEVIIYNKTDFSDLINEIRPNKLFKGSQLRFLIKK